MLFNYRETGSYVLKYATENASVYFSLQTWPCRGIGCLFFLFGRTPPVRTWVSPPAGGRYPLLSFTRNTGSKRNAGKSLSFYPSIVTFMFTFFTPPIFGTPHLQFFIEINCQKSTPSWWQNVVTTNLNIKYYAKTYGHL